MFYIDNIKNGRLMNPCIVEKIGCHQLILDHYMKWLIFLIYN